jgi:hypothetical protein
MLPSLLSNVHGRNAAARNTPDPIFGVLLGLAIAGSLWIDEVSVGELIEGFPGLLSYIRGTLPVFHVDNFIADIAEWHWGLAAD